MARWLVPLEVVRSMPAAIPQRGMAAETTTEKTCYRRDFCSSARKDEQGTRSLSTTSIRPQGRYNVSVPGKGIPDRTARGRSHRHAGRHGQWERMKMAKSGRDRTVLNIVEPQRPSPPHQGTRTATPLIFLDA